ncbi:MAG: hypothetical protein WC058_15955 [Phycisphaeraceae bacterium]
MNTAARNAWHTIRRCVASERVRLLSHFTRRMDERGETWPDVLAVLDAPAAVRPDGADEWGRARRIISGEAADGLPLGMVCVIGRDDAGDLTVFITLFWEAPGSKPTEGAT